MHFARLSGAEWRKDTKSMFVIGKKNIAESSGNRNVKAFTNDLQ